MTLSPLLEANFAIQIHALFAIVCFFLGGVVLFRGKGDRAHRIAGRVWVALMLVVAVSSLFIHVIRLIGIWSPIHLLSIATIWFLVKGVWLARQGRIAEHRTAMQTTYLGALVLAGGFTFLPGRIMHEVFFEGPQPWVGIVVSAVLVAGLLFLLFRLAKESGFARRRTVTR